MTTTGFSYEELQDHSIEYDTGRSALWLSLKVKVYKLRQNVQKQCNLLTEEQSVILFSCDFCNLNEALDSKLKRSFAPAVASVIVETAA